jgi:cellulose biosynthesis protein BcsQ
MSNFLEFPLQIKLTTDQVRTKANVNRDLSVLKAMKEVPEIMSAMKTVRSDYVTQSEQGLKNVLLNLEKGDKEGLDRAIIDVSGKLRGVLVRASAIIRDDYKNPVNAELKESLQGASVYALNLSDGGKADFPKLQSLLLEIYKQANAKPDEIKNSQSMIKVLATGAVTQPVSK